MVSLESKSGSVAFEVAEVAVGLLEEDEEAGGGGGARELLLLLLAVEVGYGSWNGMKGCKDLDPDPDGSAILLTKVLKHPPGKTAAR